jgi:hypothetical protein
LGDGIGGIADDGDTAEGRGGIAAAEDGALIVGGVGIA